MLNLAIGIGGLLLLSFIAAFVFGREYSEGTAKNMPALPVGRHWFVLAKLVVAAVWWFLLVATVFVEAILVGAALSLPEFSPGLLAESVRNTFTSAGVVATILQVTFSDNCQ